MYIKIKMNLIEAKITSMIALGLGSLFMGFLPLLLTRYTRNRFPLFLSTLLCFGAGVLLATSMVHMLPEIRESLLSYAQHAELLFCGGFFIVYCIDEIAHLFKNTLHSHVNIQSESQSLLQNQRRHSADGFNYGTTNPNAELVRQPGYNPNYRENVDNVFYEATPSCSYSQPNVENKPSQICHIAHQEPCRSTNTSSASLIISLTIHAILEGLAVGLEVSTSQVLLMLAAIAAHKLVIGFCLGAELSSSRQTTAWQYFISIIMFSFGSVIGIGVGMSITSTENTIPSLFIPVMQGLAGGTLLYITVSEVLPRERAQWHQKHDKRAAGILQFIAVGIGFSVMSTAIKFLHD